jgi:hypothetical protein
MAILIRQAKGKKRQLMQMRKINLSVLLILHAVQEECFWLHRE